MLCWDQRFLRNALFMIIVVSSFVGHWLQIRGGNVHGGSSDPSGTFEVRGT